MSSSSSSDQLPSLGDSWRRLRDALSFSNVRVRGVTGTHLLHVRRYYPRVDGAVSPGECIKSEFGAGGRRWKLLYYPNGADEERRGQAAAQLMLLDQRFSWRWRATAEYRVTVLGRGGEPARSCAVGPRSYLSDVKPFDVEVLTATAEEQSSARRRPVEDDDSLVVRCDVTVLNVDMESRVMWCLRKFLN